MKPATNSSTATSAIEAAKAAAAPPLRPPKQVTLRHGDEPYWLGIIDSRTRDEWSDNDLVIAAQLARCQCDIETHSLALDNEQPLVMDRFNQWGPNPRIAIVDRLTTRALALNRALNLSGNNSQIKAPIRKLHRQAAAARKELKGEGLLAS